jgi:ribonuclease P/MRP protein subunit POP8
VPRNDARGFRAGVGMWTGSVAAEDIGIDRGGGRGGGGRERVQVAWRVVGETGALGMMGSMGDGHDLFQTG